MSLAKEPAAVSPPKAASPPRLTQAVCTGPPSYCPTVTHALSLGLSKEVLVKDTAVSVLVC